MRRHSFLVLVTVIFIGLVSPVMAQYSGSYDVGGGSMDFSSPASAAALVSINGVTGPVICNIYGGVWSGTLNFPHNIPGVSPVNTITFRNAPGQFPALTATQRIVYMNRADYITIQGLEFTDCEEDAILFEGTETDSCKGIRIIGNYVHSTGTSINYNTAGIRGSYGADCEIVGNEVDGDVAGIIMWHSDRCLIANNMVYGCSPGIFPNQAIDRCLEIDYGANNQIYYNSAYGVTSHGLTCYYTTSPIIYNNAIYQDGSDQRAALHLSHVYGTITSDYNDLYAPDSYVGYNENYEYIQTLAGWQDTMGVDVHSISADPNFISSTNLHVNHPSPLGFSGAELTAVRDDFDGEERKTSHSDIGADEYLFPLAGSYDINGGNNDFSTLEDAIDYASLVGLCDHVSFNVYSDTYNGQIDVPNIPGTSETATLTIQPAFGQTVVITNTTGTSQTDGNGFYLIGADYITIRGFEITNTAANGIMNSFTGTDSSAHNSFIGNYIHDVGVLGDYAGIYLLNSPDCDILGNEIESDYYGIHLNPSKRCLIANNMVYFASLSGIYDDEGTDNHYYFNSVYQGVNPTTTYNMYLYHGTNLDVKNNVLYHSGGGTHYSFSIAGDLLTYPVTSDHNDLYAPSAYVGYFGGNQTTLANWQTATGLDGNSISADPNFVSTGTPDLHFSVPSPLDSAGTHVAEVTDDFDGDTRDAVSPDIGADEIMAPLAGVYDIGGGANHFTNPLNAVEVLMEVGMGGPVIFSIFTGTYNGQVTISNTVNGLGAANTLTFQSAPGESPIIICPDISAGGRGFRISSADYVTVQGLEITNCYFDGIAFVGVAGDSATHNRAIGNYIHNVGTGSTAIFAQRIANCEVIGNEITDCNAGIYCALGRSNLIANNMVYGMESAGLWDYYGLNDRFYYNSVYMDTSKALWVRNPTNPIIQNNILFQNGTGNSYAFYIQTGITGAVSDYNDLYAPNGYAGYYSGNQTTLANWQTATGLDLNSISADPNFISGTAPFELHIFLPSPVNDAGTPIAEVADDFDGDVRDASYPDMGADEANPLAGVYDVGGGANHFPNPVTAAEVLTEVGMVGPVTFNIFTGTYDGQISVPNTVNGLGEVNTLTFQSAPGESPIISCTSPIGRGFWITSADYVTIQDLEIANCNADGICFVGTASDTAMHNRAIGNYIHDIGSGYSAIFAQRVADCEVIGNDITNAPTGIYCASGRGNLIANNMVYETSTAGLWNYYGLNDHFYYNSVYMDTSKALWVRNPTNPIIQNNILFQNGSGNSYAFYIQTGITGAVSDHNDLYAPNGYVGYFSGSQTTLADWQTATGFDANSISANPNFVSTSSPFDLHINTPSIVENAGTPVGDVSDDFDGDSRDPITPDIGADEVGIVGPPEAVEDLVITLSSSTDDSTDITLIWSPALNAQAYHIYKSTTEPGSGFTLIGSTPDTTYTDTNAIIEESNSFYYITADNEPMDAGLDRSSSKN